jgi:DNA-binding CsgD family transcriptional regulator
LSDMDLHQARTLAARSPLPFVGRDAELATAERLVAQRPGALLVAGPPGCGRTRLAHEVAERLIMDGAVLVPAERGAGGPWRRLVAGLDAAGLPQDPDRATRLHALVVLLGDVDGEIDEVGALAQRLAGGRALAIGCAASPGGAVPAVEIGPLETAGARELVLVAAPGIDEVSAGEVLALAGGLPGLVIGLAEAARMRATLDEPIALSSDARAYAASRIAGLGERELELARTSALLAPVFLPEEVAELAGMDELEVTDGLDELVFRGVLQELPPPGPPRLRFAERIVPAALLASLRPGDRRRRSAAALAAGRARGADPADLALAALRAADGAAVVELSVRAAEAARRREDPRSALVHAERALRWWSAGLGEDARLDALSERGLALHALSQWPEAIADLEAAARARHAGGHEAEAVELAAACADSYWKLGDRVSALRVLDEHLASDALGPEPTTGRAEALAQGAILSAIASRYRQARDLALRARAEALACGAHEAGARALIALGIADVRGGGGPAGLEHLRRARAEADAHGLDRQAAVALNNECACLLGLGRPAEVLGLADDGIARARRMGSEELELILGTNRGEALLALGRLEEGRTALQRAGRGFRRLGSTHISHAEPYLEQMAPLAVGHAIAAVESGSPDEAAGVLHGALAAWRTTDERLDVMPVLALAAMIEPAERAEQWRDELSAIAAVSGIPVAAAYLALAEAALQQRGDPAAAADLRREAAGHFDASGLAWWSAMAFLAAGRTPGAEATGGDLNEARHRFLAMGAAGWRTRAEAALRASGQRVGSKGRPRAREGELTAREREVLALLDQGLNNREIADRLFIAERTVSRHTQGLFTKLGVSSRMAALRAARERGMLPDQEPWPSPDPPPGFDPGPRPGGWWSGSAPSV